MSLSFCISPYRPADEPAIREFFPEFAEEISGELHRGLVLVARHGRRAVGFSWTKWFEEPAHYDVGVRRFGEVQEVHVHPEFRNRGIATALLSRTVRAAVRKGCEALYLETDDFNAAARRVYERCGFRYHNLVIRYKLPLR